MATEKDVRIRITADASSAERALKTFQSSATELSAKFSNLNRAFNILGETLQGLGRSLDVGQNLKELSTSFDNLYGKTDAFVKRGIAPLREALGGLVSDLDIYRTANFAAQSGLNPEDLIKIASAAESLGDTIQKGPTEAFEDLTRAIAKGTEKQLEAYGIQLQGVESSKKLGEALRQIEEKSKAAGEQTRTSKDAYDQLIVTFSNSWARISRTANESELLAKVFDYLADSIRGAEYAFNYFFGGDTLASIDKKIQDTGLKLKEMAQLSYFGGEAEKQNVLKGLEQQMFALFKKRDEILAADRAASKQSSGTGNKGFDPFAGGIDKGKKQLEELEKSWRAFKQEISKESLTKSLDKAISEGDGAAFESLKEQFAKSTAAGFEEAFQGIADPNKQRYIQAATDLASLDYEEKFSEANKKIAEDAQRELEDKFQQSADFFASVFENAITGTTFDLEDALKRLAVGFASTLAASIAQSLGFSFGNVGSLQGLGGALAGSLWQGLGGKAVGSTIGDLIGGVGAAGAGAAAAGAFGGSAGIVAGVTGAGPVASGTAYGGYLAAAGAAGPPGWLVAAIVGAGALLLPKIFDGIGKVFGKLFGGSQDPDELARRAFRKELSKTGLGEDLILPTVRGDVKLSQIDYKKFNQTFAGKDFGDQALGLVAPFSQVLTGGGKLGEDFALIFAQAVGNAKNYNEAIINTLSLMSKLGVSAGEAKDKFKELFLDGKVTLDQFTVGVQNLNFIAQEDLVGPNSVADAINALASAIDSPRVQLKALELSFKEMAQLGIDTSAEIYAYLIDKWGPGVADVFKALTDAGIDTWQEIANASADQLVVIFNALKNLNVDMQGELSRTAKNIASTFSDSGTKAASEFEKATEPVIKRLREIGDEAVKTGGVLDTVISQISSNLKGVDNKITDTKSNLGGISGTVPNNEFRA